MAIRYLDLVNGSDSNDGLTPITPKKTFSSITPAAGDTVKIKASPAPIPVGGNAQATWTDLSKQVVVTWDTPMVKVIDNCDTAWTVGPQGTASTYGNDNAYKKPSGAACPIITSAGPVGLIAYRALGSTMDFSAYQSVSFWVRVSTVGAQAAGSSRMSLRLCSDAAGTTTVNTIPIPPLTAVNRWTLVTVDTGGNLGSSIQSVAFYADQTVGSPKFNFENILACKNTPDALALSSLIGKGTPGETYYGIQSIGNISNSGCTIWLDNQTETFGGQGRGYAAQTAGLNETLPLWKREPITLTQMGVGLPSQGATTLWSATVSGGAYSQMVNYEFGYSDLSLSVPDSETWIDCQNGFGIPFIIFASRFVKASGLSGVRANFLLQITGTVSRNNEVYFGSANNLTTGTASLTASCARNLISINYANNGGAFGISAFATNGLNTFHFRQINNNSGNAIQTGPNDLFDGALGGSRTLIANNGSTSINLNSPSTVIRNAIIRASGSTVAITHAGAPPWMMPSYLENIIVNDPIVYNVANFLDFPVYFKKFGGVEGDDRIYMSGATVFHEDTEWRCNLPNGALRPESMPAEIQIGRIACIANRPVTVLAKLKRDHANAGSQLVAAGRQLAGVPNDVVGSMAAVGAYEDVSITFTPTESGYIDILWRAFTSTNNTNAYLSTVKTSGTASATEVNRFNLTDRGSISLANVSGGGPHLTHSF